MEIYVVTPAGVGIVWGIAPDKVLVDFGWSRLVAFKPEDVGRIEG